jgi:hypothetical protein
MKKPLLFSTLFVLLLCVHLHAQCPTTEVDFTSQAQIDAFPTNYPSCTNMPYTIDISGADITNLAGLSQLTSLTNNLRIHGNTVLTNLSGLDNINSAIGGLDIYDNPALASLTALGGITSTGGSLRLENNPLLTSLTGLGGITSIGGGLNISLNPLLTNLTGLDNVASVGAGFGIASNAALASFTGLGGLHTIGITFNITSNPSLTSITALSGLTSIGGPLTVSNNASLTSLSGLDNIASTSITLVNLLTNASLSYCGVTSICNYLSIPANPANIFDNVAGCNSRTQVEAACSPMPIELLAFEAHQQGKDCLLHWRTASEHDNSRFEVEHSRNGVSFEKIGMVAGNGTSTQVHDYDFLHQSPIPDKHYYRLKQYDLDGNYSYSKVRDVTITENNGVFVYPNPITTGSFHLLLGKPAAENLTLRILQMDGQAVWSQTISGDVGTQTIQVNDLTAGVYVLQVTGENGVVFRQEIIKY